MTSGNSAAPDFERLFLDDLVKEMTQFRSAFEQLMALLTTFHSTDASALLTRALKAIDEMNSTMAMYQDVRAPNPARPHPTLVLGHCWRSVDCVSGVNLL